MGTLSLSLLAQLIPDEKGTEGGLIGAGSPSHSTPLFL